MRKITRCFVFMILCCLKIAVQAQVSVTLPIDYDAAIGYHGISNANNNYGDAIQNAAYAISDIAGLNVNRALIHFDLSSLPANAQIISAKLNLYSTGPLGTLAGSQGNNGALLQRIVQPWDPNTVTWNSQPDSTSINQVVLPKSTSPTQDYLNIDILKLVRDIQQNANNGLILKLIKEVDGNALLFCSANYADLSKHPTVTIQYRTTNMPSGNYDAAIGYNGDSNADTNYGKALQNGAYAFPGSTSGYNVNRALIHFDLSQIPAGAVITSAKLNLHATGPIGNAVGHTGNANSSVLQRVTETWTENGATWNNQPATTSSNQVVLPASTSPTQDYLGIDVKQLVSDMLNYGNNGFLLKLVSQTSPNALLFCSFDYQDASKRPSLDVQYYVKQTMDEDYDAAIGYNGASGADTNYGDAIQNAAYCISNSTKKITNTNLPTQNLSQNVNRALMHFNLSSVPKNQYLLTAKLNLYATGPIGNVQGHLGTNNSALLQAATESWTASAVTWNTQPSSTNVNQVSLPQSTSTTQDYLAINVRNLVNDMIQNQNNGFMLKMVNEQPSNGLLFCSANHPDVNKHPKLEVVFGTPVLSVNLSSISLPATSSDNKAIIVSSNANWTVSSDHDWLISTASSGSENQTITLTATANPTIQSRTAVITVSVPGAIERKVTVTQAAGAPNLSISSSALRVQALSSTVGLNLNSNTAWAVTGIQPWLAISKNSGTGNEILSVTVSANQKISQRSAILVFSANGVADQTCTVTQEAATPTLTVTPQVFSVRALSDSTKLIHISSNSTWTASSDQNWLVINKISGSGNEEFSFTTALNTSSIARTAKISILVEGLGTKTVTVSQDAPTLSLSATSVSVSPTVSSSILTVRSNTKWNVSSNQVWLSVNSSTGQEEGTLSVTTTANKAALKRIGILTFSASGLADQNFTVVQEAAATSFSVNQINLTMGVTGSQNKIIEFTTNANWKVSSNQAWLSLGKSEGFVDGEKLNTSNGLENQTIAVATTNNDLATTRFAVISFSVEGLANQNFTVTQDAAAPTISISTQSLAFGASLSLTKPVSITSNANWTISSSEAWLSLSKTSGLGNENLSIAASPNVSSIIRTATVTIKVAGLADKTISVTQDGTTGITNVAEQRVLVYPNPVRDVLYFDENLANCKISVIESKGTVVLSKQISDGKIDLSGLPTGHYIVRIIDKAGVVTKSIIKE